jgi:hypothetical protein
MYTVQLEVTPTIQSILFYKSNKEAMYSSIWRDEDFYRDAEKRRR